MQIADIKKREFQTVVISLSRIAAGGEEDKRVGILVFLIQFRDGVIHTDKARLYGRRYG